MIPRNCVGKEIDKPFPSERKYKKLQVCTKSNGSIVNVHFGDTRYEDYTQHGDNDRRERYLKRSSGIRDKDGKLTKNDKTSPNYWSRKILW